jgi:phage-related minor tail protein
MAEQGVGADARTPPFVGGVEAARAYAEALDRAGAAQALLERSGRSMGATLSSALSQATLRGRDLGDALRAAVLSVGGRALSASLRPVGNALGAAVSQGVGELVGRALPFAKGGVVDGPALFPLAGGRMGVMGERGAEAVLPLARGPDGRLGVQAGGGAVQVTVQISTPDVEGFRRSESQIAALVGRAVARGGRNL